MELAACNLECSCRRQGVRFLEVIQKGAVLREVAKLRRGDFYQRGDDCCLWFREKRGLSREIPVRHDLLGYLRAYLAAGGLEHANKPTPLFRTAIGRTKELTGRGMTRNDIERMVKRRLRDADLSMEYSPHSFRVTSITDLLSQGVPLEDVQYLAGHADPRTTRLYDRRKRRVTRNIVERISV